MKIYSIIYFVLFFISSTPNLAFAENIDLTLSQLTSSPSFLKTKTIANTNLQSCQSDFYVYDPVISNGITGNTKNKTSLIYLNNTVKAQLKKMSSGVFRHVTMEVAASLFSFNSDALSPESIAKHITAGTQGFLPFIYANGVTITQVISKGKTIIYRTEMPITKNNRHVAELAAAGREFSISAVCDDLDKINDLLEQKIIIQYDYYDSTGAFYSSFSLNGYSG